MHEEFNCLMYMSAPKKYAIKAVLHSAETIKTPVKHRQNVEGLCAKRRKTRGAAGAWWIGRMNVLAWRNGNE